MQEAEERQLIDRCRNGDWGAFEALVDEHQGMVYALGYRLTQSAEDADGVAQDTFIKVFRGLRDFDGRATMRTWLYRIAVRTAMDLLRRRRSEPAAASLDDPRTTKTAAAPESGLEFSQLRDAVTASMARLPEDQRVALTLVAFEGLSYSDAAEAMACSEGTLAWRVARAREKLRDMLGPMLET